MVKIKTYAYITRRIRDKTDLLVFTQQGHPEAGLQVPGGTVDPGEDALAACLREAAEEAGLTALKLQESLGTTSYFHKQKQEWHDRSYFRLSSLTPLPDAWTHAVASNSGDQGFVFEYFWIPVERAYELAGRQGELAYRLSTEPDLELRIIIAYLLRLARKSMERLELPGSAVASQCTVYCVHQEEQERLRAQALGRGGRAVGGSHDGAIKLSTPVAYGKDKVDTVRFVEAPPVETRRGAITFLISDGDTSSLLSGRAEKRSESGLVTVGDPLADVALNFMSRP